jgi:asparagine synthase (glutamine-hydrolysing)
MCGISGIVSLSGAPVDPEAQKRMCDALAHRGPDDAGYAFFHPGRDGNRRGAGYTEYADAEFRHINEHLPVFGGDHCRRELTEQDYLLGLGQRRLTILDLTSMGHQPMCTRDRRYWIVHNGEVYNFPELREQLRARDHAFRTRTDTEVILHLWEECGATCLDQLNGMFAFAVYDRITNTVTLARDRFGVKPLYYAVTDDFLLFASEIKAIFATGLIEPRFHPPSLVEYVTFQNVFSRETIWAEVQILQPGEFLVANPGAKVKPVLSRYHDAGTSFDPNVSDEDQAITGIASGFGAAVRRQLISDVPVGSYLSGGMDSGSIVAVAGQEIDRLHTFTGGFDLTNVNGIEQGFDERRLAERLSYLLQTEHYDVVLHAGDMPAAMDRITWHMDDPRVGMCHQNWYVAKLASRFVKVCLAGTGGDELFAGYPWRYRAAFASEGLEQFDERLFLSWHRLLPPDELAHLLAPDLRQHIGAARASFDQILADAPPSPPGASVVDDRLHRALYFESRTFLHGLLVTDDHISMAHGLEARVPFLDNDLAALAWSLPPALKLRVQSIQQSASETDYIDSADGKYILRRAMENYLDSEFLYQKKRGFSPPDENWYRGPSMDYIKTILFDPRTRSRDWLEHRFLEEKLNEHFEGRRNNRLLIWSMLSLEWIQRHFADAHVDATQPQPIRLVGAG